MTYDLYIILDYNILYNEYIQKINQCFHIVMCVLHILSYSLQYNPYLCK